MLFFISAFPFFSLSYLMLVTPVVYSFFEKFVHVFSRSKQNNGENILQNSEFLVAMIHDGHCCEVFL